MDPNVHRPFSKEIWTKILDSELSYFDLKRVAATSTNFRMLCKGPNFADRLFRGTPRARLASGSQVTLHPIFTAGHTFVGKSVKEFKVKSIQSKKEWVIVKLACASEFATDPPVETIELQKYPESGDPPEWGTGIGGGGKLTVLSGVTVKDLLGEIAKAWRKKKVFESSVLGLDGEPDSEEEDAGEMTYLQHLSLQNNRIWSKWSQLEITGQGNVLLSPCGYTPFAEVPDYDYYF
ncbi:hypothetical protein P7C70_g7150, partial [Phenoliferia sp. Uapishka_3]